MADAQLAEDNMNISYSKPSQKKPYINFRMRKFIHNFILENSEIMFSMTAQEKAKFISEKIESLIVENYWIKDKRKDVNYNNQSKAA